MSANGILQIALYCAVLTALSIPLGSYITAVFNGTSRFAEKMFGPLERFILRASHIDPAQEMTWRAYAVAALVFNLIGIAAVYLFQRMQAMLPLNPTGMGAVSADSAFNTAASFASNTNWQGYAGEATMSYLTQMLGLSVQNFLSAATATAVLVALIRGFTRASSPTIGNFWADVTRATVSILLPLSIVMAVFLVEEGVVQTFSPYRAVSLLEQVADADGKQVVEQQIAVGPAASQIAIKQLGTNGGGFFNANSSHPFENPTPLTNFVEVLAILLIPAALCFTFGQMVGDKRQGYALYAAMMIIFVIFTIPCVDVEQSGNPLLTAAGADARVLPSQPGGNMEGKEARFGPIASGIWATATTAASNGSVNAMHDSFMPLASLSPLIMMQLGEVVFGGVGSGLYGMIAFVIVTVFVAGLMVGRTPEYLGKKITAFEMKAVSVVVLIPCSLVLIGTALGVSVPSGAASIANPGAHGFSQMLYAYTSMGNNNGSAFAGFGANVPFHNILGGVVMLVSRYWLIVPTLALAGSLAQKVKTPRSLGTLDTHTPLFVCLLIGTVVIVGALTFIPALALGPIVEHLQLSLLK